MAGILGYTEEAVVSADFIGELAHQYLMLTLVSR